MPSAGCSGGGVALGEDADAPERGALILRERDESVSAAASYALGTIYSYPGYGGRSYTATASNPCSAGYSYSFSNLGSIGWNDDIDSFRSYNGCATRVWEHTSFSGAYYGYYSYSSDMGSWRNRASSIRWA
ncbi:MULTISPECIES: hypothetical protein [Microbacterium]|uniref:hypothetical protein n=1 Tax=Microbacterium TaxID=33882 RepID=UPI00217E4BF1|nr:MULTISPECIES: hypothetical protein [Microbacterium]UWF77687.1 hypothetical protein JSY13_00960 [Microbacterium neungamense]WCM55856.1 hypothetical protein JRG78_00970 [Microbacterium sp. EF45047]